MPLVALTTGREGAVGCDAAGCRTVPAILMEATVERLGSGDAFAAGFLAEYLAGASLEPALRLGVATAALKRTIPGDMLIATRAEVEAVRTQEAGRVALVPRCQRPRPHPIMGSRMAVGSNPAWLPSQWTWQCPLPRCPVIGG